MKRAVMIGLVALFCASVLPSCATLYVNAPPGEDIKLMAEDEPMQTKIEKRHWYLLWGLVPISDNSVEPIIADYGLKGVRVETYYGVVDFIIDIFLGWTTLHTRTVQVEGTR